MQDLPTLDIMYALEISGRDLDPFDWSWLACEPALCYIATMTCYPVHPALCYPLHPALTFFCHLPCRPWHLSRKITASAALSLKQPQIYPFR
eukprot:scaffold680457_cov71-Prasinocladus_malaysianus.AAC.1